MVLGSICCSLIRMSESFSLGCIHDIIGMFWRRVNREQLHNGIASVDEVEFLSRGYSEQIASGNVMGFPADDSMISPILDLMLSKRSARTNHPDYEQESVLSRDRHQKLAESLRKIRCRSSAMSLFSQSAHYSSDAMVSRFSCASHSKSSA